MPELKNSEIISFSIQTLIRIIGKRTAPSYAYSTVENTINQLLTKYDFLRFIQLENTFYSETKSGLTIDPEINHVEKKNLVNCVKEIIDLSTKAIGENADYFFIREIRDNLGYIDEPAVADFLLALNYKQFEYIIDRRREIEHAQSLFNVKNSEVIQPVITALVYLLAKIMSEEDALEAIASIMRQNYEKYDFLKHIHIFDARKADNSYTTLTPVIDDIIKPKMAEALEMLIVEVGKSVEQSQNISFINNFKTIIGDITTAKIREMGVNLHKADAAIRYQNWKIMQKVLHALLDVLSSKTSKSSAITIVGETIVLLQGTRNVLNYVKINISNDEDTDFFTVLPEINSVESYKLGAAFRDVITTIQENHKEASVIEEFKKKLGDEYLAEIEKLGVNLYFLELKYR